MLFNIGESNFSLEMRVWVFCNRVLVLNWNLSPLDQILDVSKQRAQESKFYDHLLHNEASTIIFIFSLHFGLYLRQQLLVLLKRIHEDRFGVVQMHVHENLQLLILAETSIKQVLVFFCYF